MGFSWFIRFGIFVRIFRFIYSSIDGRVFDEELGYLGFGFLVISCERLFFGFFVYLDRVVNNWFRIKNDFDIWNRNREGRLIGMIVRRVMSLGKRK